MSNDLRSWFVTFPNGMASSSVPYIYIDDSEDEEPIVPAPPSSPPPPIPSPPSYERDDSDPEEDPEEDPDEDPEEDPDEDPDEDPEEEPYLRFVNVQLLVVVSGVGGGSTRSSRTQLRMRSGIHRQYWPFSLGRLCISSS
ncbi:hypothetical protein E3N88_40744 [Mikania micrantha]|uniref:Uncharacterized protein n=1 Tax=Mikania micrantha TaxID=192012 RepID=A0A5N6LNL6_9ASTR|nr:hypothetical protein E3N88_40744 [Mikania micrantha]